MFHALCALSGAFGNLLAQLKHLLGSSHSIAFGDSTSGYGSLLCALLEQTALMSRSTELIACGGWTAARATQRMGFSVCLSSTGCPWLLKLDQIPQRLRGLVGCTTRGGICELLSIVEYCSISSTSVLPSETPLLKGARKRPSIQLLKWYVLSGTPHRCLYPNQEFGKRESGNHDSGSSEV